MDEDEGVKKGNNKKRRNILNILNNFSKNLVEFGRIGLILNNFVYFSCSGINTGKRKILNNSCSNFMHIYE